MQDLCRERGEVCMKTNEHREGHVPEQSVTPCGVRKQQSFEDAWGSIILDAVLVMHFEQSRQASSCLSRILISVRVICSASPASYACNFSALRMTRERNSPD
jgi:hypothetical protein